MFNHLQERMTLPDDTVVELSGWDHAADASEAPRSDALHAFGLDAGLPVWHYRAGSNLVEKRVVPKERVRLDKDTITDEARVSEEVRKEQVEVDGDRDRDRT